VLHQILATIATSVTERTPPYTVLTPSLPHSLALVKVCVLVCILQRIAAHCMYNVLQCAVVCCSVLQCCSALHAVCCSMLQCAVVCRDCDECQLNETM